MDVVLKDISFYQSSHGGLTITGGEPLVQPEFLASILEVARDFGIHTCVETSGFAPWANFERILEYTDCFLYDIKETDSERHQLYTGASPTRIWDNLRLLDQAGATIILRCPIIPGFNDRSDHFSAIGKMAQNYMQVCHVEIEPYHALGITKSSHIGVEYRMPDISNPDESMVDSWIAQVSAWTDKPVRRA